MTGGGVSGGNRSLFGIAIKVYEQAPEQEFCIMGKRDVIGVSGGYYIRARKRKDGGLTVIESGEIVKQL